MTVPPNPPPDIAYQGRPMDLINRTDEHLRLLAIFHFVVSGLTFLFACFPLVYVVMGIAFLVSPPTGSGAAAFPPAVAWVLITFGGGFTLLGWTLAVLMLFTGLFLRRQRRYTFCTVVAGISCLAMPLGTILGVFTLVVLMRPGVKEAFSRAG